jgi:pimeloyl-ACP methyl ester carboxylesterase
MTTRRPVTLAAALVALVITAAACAPNATWQQPSPSPSASASATDSISWRSCGAEAQKLNPSLPRNLTVQCGNVTVPQNWSTAVNGKAPDGKTFDIAVMRIRSTKQHDRIGSVVMNPGGPGGSGVDFLPYLAGRVSSLAERFDLVSFDPRGVGRSAPVKCISDADLDASFGYEPDPVSDASFQGVVSLSRKIADACSAKYGEQLSLFSTEQTARDIDALRAALGEQKLNFLGYSYGTLLGGVYAELFPKNIRTMVLDGAVDPTQTPVQSTEGQAGGFELAFGNFTTWCKQNAAKCPISADPRGAVLSALDKARTSPVKGTDGRSATAGWVFYAIVSTMYSQNSWQYLAQGIGDLSRNNARIIFLLADSYAERDSAGHYKNLFDANNAVNCADAASVPTVEEVRQLQASWRTKYPLFGAPLATGLITCAVWPAKHDPYPVGPAVGAPPIVVVGTKGDPATPYESTAKLANMLGTGTVVTWEGEGHTAYPETPCIRNAIDTYFINLTVPAKGLTCPPA